MKYSQSPQQPNCLHKPYPPLFNKFDENTAYKIDTAITKTAYFSSLNSKKILEKLIVFQGFFVRSIFTANQPYVAKLELTILTNLLLIINPHGYLPCAKLFAILVCSGILISSVRANFFRLAGLSQFYTNGVLLSTSSALASLEPRDYRVVFFIQKTLRRNAARYRISRL